MKSITAAKHRRSQAEVAAFEKHHEVGLENDVAAGGSAAIMHSRKRKTYDVWLFGPLSFLDRAYGSLIIELAHYDQIKVFMKRDKNWNDTWWRNFQRDRPVSVPARF
jgi:hypothetical protein